MVLDNVAGQLHRLPLGQPGSRHRPPNGVVDDFLSHPLGVGPVLTEAGHAGQHDARSHCLEKLVAKTPSLQLTWLERLDDEVAAADQAPDDLGPVRGRQVGHDRALVRVEVEEQRALLGVVAALAAGVAARWLDLDHLGPEVGEKLAGERASHAGGQLHHSQPSQGLVNDRARHDRSSWPSRGREATTPAEE